MLLPSPEPRRFGTARARRKCSSGAISGVPVGPSYTIDAYSDPMQSVVATRYNVTVSPGGQLGIGALNLSVSPQEGTPPMEVLPNPDFGNYNTA